MGDRGLSRRRDPFGGLGILHSQIDDLFGGLFGGDLSAGADNFPAMNVYIEDDQRLVVELNVSGFDLEDIEIHVHDDVLEIMGESRRREEDRERGRRNYIVRETASSFFRTIRLPRYADGDNIDATFDNGILRIAVPFKESGRPQNIEIGSDKSEDDRRAGRLGRRTRLDRDRDTDRGRDKDRDRDR
jgi:HSP20 family protein